MSVIATNERYKLETDPESNLLYISIQGLWKTKEGYLEDLEDACRQMKPGFKIKVDLIKMKPPGPEIGKVHEDAQRILMKYGLAATAEVQADRALLRMALERYSENSGMSKRVFLSHEEADQWLASLKQPAAI